MRAVSVKSYLKYFTNWIIWYSDKHLHKDSLCYICLFYVCKSKGGLYFNVKLHILFCLLHCFVKGLCHVVTDMYFKLNTQGALIRLQRYMYIVLHAKRIYVVKCYFMHVLYEEITHSYFLKFIKSCISYSALRLICTANSSIGAHCCHEISKDEFKNLPTMYEIPILNKIWGISYMQLEQS